MIDVVGSLLGSIGTDVVLADSVGVNLESEVVEEVDLVDLVDVVNDRTELVFPDAFP